MGYSSLYDECVTAVKSSIDDLQIYIVTNPHFQAIGLRMIDTWNLSLENETHKEEVPVEIRRAWDETKALRKENGLTQDELAKLAGISRVTMGKLERAQLGSITLKTMGIILDALGHELDFKRKDSFGLPSLAELY